MKSFDLTIADVHFTLNSRDDIQVVENDPNYGAFLSAPQGTDGRIPVPAHLVMGETLERNDFRHLLFDTGGSWSAYKDGADLLLRLPLMSHPGENLWVVRFHGDNCRVTIHCGPPLVQNAGDQLIVRNPLHYPLDQILMMLILANQEGMVLHAAGIGTPQGGIALAGPSGAGKTTLMRLLGSQADLDFLSDDRVIFRRQGDAIRIHGTPWAGEGGAASRLSPDLAALVFLHQGDEHRLRSLTPREALPQLLPISSVPLFDRKRTENVLDFCDRFLSRVPAYELHFRPDAGVITVLRELAEAG